MGNQLLILQRKEICILIKENEKWKIKYQR